MPDVQKRLNLERSTAKNTTFKKNGFVISFIVVVLFGIFFNIATHQMVGIRDNELIEQKEKKSDENIFGKVEEGA